MGTLRVTLVPSLCPTVFLRRHRGQTSHCRSSSHVVDGRRVVIAHAINDEVSPGLQPRRGGIVPARTALSQDTPIIPPVNAFNALVLTDRLCGSELRAWSRISLL